PGHPAPLLWRPHPELESHQIDFPNRLLDPKMLLDNDFTCCMYAAGSRWPEYANYYGGMSLDQALRVSGCKRVGKAHSAIGDALSTAEVWKKILIAP
ncbi:PolC-type DNA polymerase III domain-containing protein, partial [Gluconobacter thailandicus]